PTTPTHPLSLPDALPIYLPAAPQRLRAEGGLRVHHHGMSDLLEERSVGHAVRVEIAARDVDPVATEDLLDPLALAFLEHQRGHQDRKSTRLNSSHVAISY